MKKIIILIAMMLPIIFKTGCSSSNDIVGNTNEEILQFLFNANFMNDIRKDNLTILDTIYIDDSKIVGFLSDTSQGYIVYEKNEKGDYIMTSNRVQGIESNELGATNFVVKYNLNKGLENCDYAYVVISNGDIVSNVEISINEYVFNESIERDKPSMILLKNIALKDTKKIEFNCRYFDEKNNELKSE